VFGSVCHGALGFIRARDRDGKLLIAGRKMTGVSDKQVKERGTVSTRSNQQHFVNDAYSASLSSFDPDSSGGMKSISRLALSVK